MHRFFVSLTAIAIAVGTAPALAQEVVVGNEASDIVVTGSLVRNKNAGYQPPPYAPPAPVQMLRRTADFAIREVVIVSDTVDEDEAKKEVLGMVRKAIDQSASSGVLIASGEIVVEPVTVANYGDLKMIDSDDDDDDPRNKDLDGQYVKFLVKVPLAPGIDAKAVLAKIDQFIKKVPQVGRAEMKPYSELTLSVVNPEQYRGAIIDLVAKDTATTGAQFGTGYGVEVTGLDKPVQWKRAGLTEVQLYLPSNSTIRPRN